MLPLALWKKKKKRHFNKWAFCKRLHCAAGCSRVPPHTRLHCAPRVGLAARAGALGTGAGRFPAVAAQTLGASRCMCLAACGHRLSHLPYSPAKALRTVCPCQTAPAVLCLRDSLLCLFFFFFPCDGILPTPAVQRCEVGGTCSACVGTCGVSPRGRRCRSLEPPSLSLQLHILTWLSGSVGLPCFPRCDLLVLFSLFFRGDACAKNNGLSPFPLEEMATGCPGSKPNVLPCFHVAQDRAGSKCCCCGWSETPG